MKLEHKIRKVQTPKGVLVPLIENYMSNSSVDFTSPEDVQFMTRLAEKNMCREDDRKEGPRVFSPSSIGNKCLRASYLTRHAVINPDAPSPYGLASHYYFLTGNFIHLKWQFVLYKMERWIANSQVFRVHDYEVHVRSKRGDFSGTIDVIVFIYGEPYIVDFKGLNPFSTKKVSLGKTPSAYRMQLSAYNVLWNSQRQLPFRIEKNLLVVEDKGWVEGEPPKPFLHEVLVPTRTTQLQRRLEKLRDHESRKRLPDPACKSLKDKAFRNCPFKGICWDEVENAQKKAAQSMRELSAQIDSQPTTTERVVKALRKREISKKGGV